MTGVNFRNSKNRSMELQILGDSSYVTPTPLVMVVELKTQRYPKTLTLSFLGRSPNYSAVLVEAATGAMLDSSG